MNGGLVGDGSSRPSTGFAGLRMTYRMTMRGYAKIIQKD